MDFLFTHHLTSYEHRLNYVKYCLTNNTYNEGECNKTYDEAYDIIKGINFYDYLQDCKGKKNFKENLRTNIPIFSSSHMKSILDIFSTEIIFYICII